MKQLLPTPDFKKIVLLSAILHFLVILSFLIQAVFFPGDDLLVEHAIRVDIIGRPDKLPPVPPSSEPPLPTPKKTETPPVTPKSSPPPALKKTKPKELQQKQTQALSKLKELSAIEKLEQQMKAEKPKPIKYKGSEISAGKDLKGISKLQAEAYFDQVEKQVRQNWALPEWLSQKNYQAQVRIRFDEKGELLAKDIVKSSGNEAFDDAVIAAVQKSLPLPPPPEKFVQLLKSEGITLAFPE